MKAPRPSLTPDQVDRALWALSVGFAAGVLRLGVAYGVRVLPDQTALFVPLGAAQ